MASFEKYPEKSWGNSQEIYNSKKTKDVFVRFWRRYDTCNVFKGERYCKDPFDDSQFFPILNGNAAYTFQHNRNNTEYDYDQNNNIKSFPPIGISAENDHVHYPTPFGQMRIFRFRSFIFHIFINKKLMNWRCP